MTPISPNEFAKIAERMRQNDEALARCPFHEFTLHYLYGEANPPRWVCHRCHGVIDQVTYDWYARGVRDARLGQPPEQPERQPPRQPPEQPPQHL